MTRRVPVSDVRVRFRSDEQESASILSLSDAFLLIAAEVLRILHAAGVDLIDLLYKCTLTWQGDITQALVDDATAGKPESEYLREELDALNVQADKLRGLLNPHAEA